MFTLLAGVCGAFRWSYRCSGQRPRWQEQCCLQVRLFRPVDFQGTSGSCGAPWEIWSKSHSHKKFWVFSTCGPFVPPIVTCMWTCCTVSHHRMDDKGEVKCIKFSIGNKILAVQRTSKSVVSSGSVYLLDCQAASHTDSLTLFAGFHQLHTWLSTHRVHAGMQGMLR